MGEGGGEGGGHLQEHLQDLQDHLQDLQKPTRKLQQTTTIHRKSGKNMQKSKIPKSWVNIPFGTGSTRGYRP